jgi:hypothetical protein
MTTAIADKSSNVLKKDADGHWYSIPAAEVDAFVQAVEAVMLAEFMSDEWYEATDDLNDRYGSYMRGDL